MSIYKNQHCEGCGDSYAYDDPTLATCRSCGADVCLGCAVAGSLTDLHSAKPKAICKACQPAVEVAA